MSMDAQNKLIVQISTEVEPYHFVGSGLRNVYLVGVEYEVDSTTGMQSAAIPCLPALMEAIGKVLVEKTTALTGDELEGDADCGASGAIDLCDSCEVASGCFGGGCKDDLDGFAEP